MGHVSMIGIKQVCLTCLVLMVSSSVALVVPKQVSQHGGSRKAYTKSPQQQQQQSHHGHWQRGEKSRHRPFSLGVLHENSNKDGDLFDRFVNPRIDDPWLPLNEAGVAQIVAPSFEIFWTVLNDSPYPTWATSAAILPTRGAFLAPTLIHGAALACCWLAGCLAAKAYEKEAYEGDIGTVIFSTIKAGAFASGLLILSTQLDLYMDLGGYVQYGEAPESDVRILTATIELLNDIVFEAIILLSYRIYRAISASV